MDDLAPAPAQRTSDGGGRTAEQNFAARKKAVRNVPETPVHPPLPDPDLIPEPEEDHQIDVLA